MKDQVAKANAAIASLETAKANLEKQLAAAKQIAETAQASASQANAAAKTAAKAAEKAQATGDAAAKAAADAAQAAADANKAAADAALEASAAKEAAIEAEKNAIKAAHNELVEVKTALETEIAKLVESDKLTDEAIKTINSTIATLQADLAELSGTVTAIQEDVTKNSADIQTLLTDVTTLKTDLATTITKLDNAIVSLDNVKADVETLKSDVKGLKESFDALEKRVEVLEIAEKEIRAAIKETNENLEAAKKDLNMQISNLSKDVLSNKEEIGKLSTKLDLQIETFNGFKANVEKYFANNTEALEDLTKRIKAAEEDLAKVQGKINTAVANLKAELEVIMAADKAELNKRIDSLTDQLSQDKADLLKEIKALQDLIGTAQEGDKVDLMKKIQSLQSLVDSIDLRVKALEDAKLKNDVDIKNITAGLKSVNDDLAALHKELKKVSPYLDAMKSEYRKMVTGLSIVNSNFSGEEGFDDVKFNTTQVRKTWTFPSVDGVTGGIPFDKKQSINAVDEFVVRVSPANADLTKDQIHFVNSKDENLDAYIEVVGVENFKGVISRAAEDKALRKVTVRLKSDFDKDKFEDVTVAGAKKVGFAMKVVAVADKEERSVISQYGLTFEKADEAVLGKLNYNVKVGSTSYKVADIMNRWREEGTTPNKTESGLEIAANKVEKHWKGDKSMPEFTEKINGVEEVYTENDEDDSRGEGNRKPALSVKVDQKIEISLPDADAKKIKGFYVSLDKEFAVESSPSEIAAWRSYEINGLDQVVKGSKTELLIPSVNHNGTSPIGDYIGFRVYAVNIDGTLVDPDGKAFYVYVGESDATAANLVLNVETKLITAAYANYNSNSVKFSTANWGRAKGGEFTYKVTYGNKTMDNISATDLVDKLEFVDAEGTVINLLNTSTKALIDNETISKVAKVSIKNVTLSELLDTQTYTITLTAKNPTSGVVAVANITVKKELPGFPHKEIYPFTNVLVGNNSKIYPVANGDNAEYDFKSVWHGLGSDVAGSGFINFVSEKAGTPAVAIVSYDATSDIVSVAKDYVNPKSANYNKKIHLDVTYNYGEISRVIENNNEVVAPWAPKWNNGFTVQFGNYVDDCKYSWNGQAPSIKYPGAVGKASYIPLSSIKATDWYDQAVNLANIGTAGTKEDLYFKTMELHFLTGANFERVDEFYNNAKLVELDKNGIEVVGGTKKTHIKMTSTSNASQGAAVPTKIQLVVVDKFDYKIVKSLNVPFMMKFNNQN